MKVLVTGATGGLGRLLCERLARDRTVDLVRAARTGAEPAVMSCDLTNRAAATALVERTRPDRIFHLAGSVSGDYERDHAVNVEAARFLCDATRQLSLTPRIVVIGSAAEYGLVAPGENPIPESRATRPVTVYGLTKAMQTALAAYYAARDVDIVVARLFNLFARGLNDQLFVGRAERLIERFRQGDIRELEFGNLSSARDYVDGDAAVNLLLRIAERGTRGEVYHVASGCPTVMRDLLARLLREAQIDPRVVREAPERRTSLGTDVPAIYADMTKTRALDNG